MELCTTTTTQSISLLPSKPSLSLAHLPIPRSIRCRRTNFLHPRLSKLVLRATYEDKPSSFAATTTEERESSVVVEVENTVFNDSPVTEQESPVADDQVNDFLDTLNLKFDSEDTYSVLFYGGSAVVALWLGSAVVGAIDSIPLIPKLMEVVGLGYSIWFTTRYLLFKENRDEFVTKVEELKQQVLGSSND
ncbi:protein CURVATURE THYLAKOID 1D, chloroplastic [Ricinus communis]|uniref:protein CURVATURE THYLAKOID 1D, chloroplastic n=1 Tax=Ricinus communis TaxID=3988 RepID=UPI00201B1F62|nr:protein CURVATURE THYLAKOID 1D, chloroplastic [Ricinus communis]